VDSFIRDLDPLFEIYSWELELMGELENLAMQIGDEKLRRKVLDFLKAPEIDLDGERLPFDECPGGAFIHHAYRGGLLQHTVAVAHLCLTISDLVEEVYGGHVDRDVVLAGALLHDVMKCYSYAYDENGRCITSPLGEKVDHLTLLTSEMYKQGFPLEVIHVAASHHGQQSPVRPKTIEALIVSVADLADSELSRQILRAAEYLVREATGSRFSCESSKEAMEVLLAKARKGWSGVRRLHSGKSK
jgi:7,8-dihydroneopterin 2',3'-cyclic phosphate phosphodiesterase